MTGPAPRHIEDDESLSQAGSRRSDGSWNFRAQPRAHAEEDDLSMVLGELSSAEVHLAAYGPKPPRPGKDAVRHFRAGALRDREFRVDHTPYYPGSPDHVSVFWDGVGAWDDRVAALLDDCSMREAT